MKKYATFFRIRFVNGLQYRSAAYAGICTQFFWGLMEILLFSAFYRSAPESFPMEFSQLTAYVWLQQAFLALFMTWFYDNDIFQAIMDGGVAYELCRPLDLYRMWFVKTAAGRMSRAVLRCMPILAVAFFLPAPYGLLLPPDIGTFLLFCLSLLLGYLVVVAFCMLIYLSAFYTVSPAGIRIVAAAGVEFLAGAIIPLPFFPQGVRRVLELLPFAAMQNAPLRIYSGAMAGGDAVAGVLLQFIWLCALLLLGKLLMRRALRRIVVQGG